VIVSRRSSRSWWWTGGERVFGVEVGVGGFSVNRGGLARMDEYVEEGEEGCSWVKTRSSVRELRWER
jgi:hypothetical protein